MGFNSLDDIIMRSEASGKNFFETVIEDDMDERQVTADESMDRMQKIYNSMKNADRSYDDKLISSSGLVGGDGKKINTAYQKGELLSGEFVGLAIEKAIKMGESNACMKKIVAAPTAGSSGVIPAVLLTYEELKNEGTVKMTEAMFVAAAIGEIIALRASISGAAGGCQAEIGSASAMAAGALTYLRNGDCRCIANAAGLALKSLLGLACDPVAGLVEVPCVKRNVIGAVNAITSSDMPIAGVISKIPPDEIIDAMKSIGDIMPACLRETAQGGLAATPAGIKIKTMLIEQDQD